MRKRFNQTLTVDAATKAAWKREIDALPNGGAYEISLDPRRPVRSNSANRWYWKNVVEPLALFLMDQEVELGSMARARDFAHYNVIVPGILGYDEIPLANGNKVLVPKPTHTLADYEFRDFADRADTWVQLYIGGGDAPQDAPALGARR